MNTATYWPTGAANAELDGNRVLPPQPEAPEADLVSLVSFYELDHDAVPTPLEPPIAHVRDLPPVVPRNS